MCLDLGSGECCLRSDAGVSLNDLAWHSVEVRHSRHDVSITVDRKSHSRMTAPGPDPELSVDNLFVGGATGVDDLLKVPLGFRGCVDEAVFNQLNLLSGLRPYSGYKRVQDVTAGCSSLFSATEEDTVSFFSSTAFVSLLPWEEPEEGAVFECELHPSGRDDGIILYSSSRHGGFVAMEIRDGHLVATVGNEGGARTELCSLKNLHDHLTWSLIRLHLLPPRLQLQVGEELLEANLGEEVLQLSGPLVLGGLDEQTRGGMQAGWSSAVKRGHLPGGGESFRGCLRGMKVNAKRIGLPHAMVTRDVSVGCRSGQGAADMPPPADMPPSAEPHPSSFLLLSRLEVLEGGQAPLEPRHMKVGVVFIAIFITVSSFLSHFIAVSSLLQVNLQNLGVHPSQLMFHVEEQPVHGHLRVDLSPDRDGGALATEENDRTFSLLDLWQGRVMYVHSGSEDQRDFFTFSIFSSDKKELPVNHLHQFDISISPVNDAPVLSLPEGNLLTLLENSKRQVGSAQHLNCSQKTQLMGFMFPADHRSTERVRP